MIGCSDKPVNEMDLAEEITEPIRFVNPPEDPHYIPNSFTELDRPNARRIKLEKQYRMFYSDSLQRLDSNRVDSTFTWYNEYGDVTKQMEYKNGEIYDTDEWIYDSIGRLVEQRSSGWFDRILIYTYNDKCRTMTNGSGSIIVVDSLDENNRVTCRIERDNANSYYSKYTWRYNDRGNCIQYTVFFDEGMPETYSESYVYDENFLKQINCDIINIEAENWFSGVTGCETFSVGVVNDSLVERTVLSYNEKENWFKSTAYNNIGDSLVRVRYFDHMRNPIQPSYLDYVSDYYEYNDNGDVVLHHHFKNADKEIYTSYSYYYEYY